MELHQIRYFLALSRTLNFTRAAEECRVSQPALSRAIKQLEDELGGDLFRRERTLTHVSDLGRAVLPVLRQCYEASGNAKVVARAFRKEGAAPLKLALARSFEMDLITPHLAEISRAFPRIEIRVFRGPPHEISEQLKSGDVEMAITGSLGDSWERLDARKLREQHYGLVVNTQHPLAQQESIELPRLRGERLLCRPHCGIAERLMAALKGREAGEIERHEVPSADDLAGLVRANFGIGVLPISQRMPEGLAVRKVCDVDLSRWLYAYSVAGRPQSPGAATLMKLLRCRDWSKNGHASHAHLERLP